MNTKHTPGPWVVEDLGANCLTIKATGGVHVEPEAKADTRDYYQRIGSATQRDPHPSLAGGIPRAVTEANARLIAAAPELLEALQRLLANREDGGRVRIGAVGVLTRFVPTQVVLVSMLEGQQ
jgi:hypothetical protein